ncbi:MAG: PepSY domain-containing protein [Gemmatimonadaceae bacterium]|nr:PepSY domain-containing protein [Gemmatimonadaceae bacterium]
MNFRAILLWVHLILGLTGFVIIAVLGVTGAYITFAPVLGRWLNPVPRVGGAVARGDPVRLVAAAESAFFPVTATSLSYGAPGEAASIELEDRTTVFVDPASARVVGSRPRPVISLANVSWAMRRLHVQLLLPRGGQLLVTLVTLEALLLTLTGLWLWWRKKHWKLWPWRGSLFRMSWDLHSATGIWFAVPVAVMALTGILLFWPAPLSRLAGVPLSPWLDAPASVIPPEGPSVRVPLARVMAVADSVRPGEPADAVAIPSGPLGSFGVWKGSASIYVDRYSGALIAVREDQPPNAADRALVAVEYAHTGELWGVPGQAIMTIGSLALAVMAMTGAVLGWKRLQILAGRRQREPGD